MGKAKYNLRHLSCNMEDFNLDRHRFKFEYNQKEYIVSCYRASDIIFNEVGTEKEIPKDVLCEIEAIIWNKISKKDKMWKQSLKVKKIRLDKRHVNYLDSVREELIKAEEIVDRIKGCDEWKKARNYFGTCFMRGLIKARPSKENGYKIEIESPKRKVVQVEELKDIVTEEQMEEIKKLLNR